MLNEKVSTQPLVSVLLPAYNAEKYIAEAIDSVLNQTYQNFELLILDDCGTDNTPKILKEYKAKDSRIKIFKNKVNLGRAKSRNKLLGLISDNSKYYIWLDSDDLFMHDILEKKVSYLQSHTHLDGVGASIQYVTESLQHIKTRYYPPTNDEIREKFLIYSPMSQGGLMLRSTLRNEKYNPDYKICEDYELWARLISRGKNFENLADILYVYRQHNEQGKQILLYAAIKETLQIKSKYLFKKEFFSTPALLRFLGESVLILIPPKLTLWLFYKLA